MQEQSQRRAVLSGKRLPKWVKQTVLNFSPNRPLHQQIRKQIAGGVCPTLVTNKATNNKQSIIFHQSLVTWNKRPLFCNGVLAHKDLSDNDVQDSISVFAEIYHMDAAELDYKIEFVRRDNMTLSLFFKQWNGSNNTVR